MSNSSNPPVLRASKPRWRATAITLLLSGCAEGPSWDDEPIFEMLDAAVGGQAPAPVVDAGPTYAPLPPNLGLPSTPSVPVVDAGPTYAPLPPNLGLPSTPSVPVSVPSDDAGQSPDDTDSTQSDASAARPTQTGDGGSSRSSGTTTTTTTTAPTGCDPAACTNMCALSGPFNCCTLLDTCGCTWAPGAYCL